jgi:hypothetical protein
MKIIGEIVALERMHERRGNFVGVASAHRAFADVVPAALVRDGGDRSHESSVSPAVMAVVGEVVTQPAEFVEQGGNALLGRAYANRVAALHRLTERAQRTIAGTSNVCTARRASTWKRKHELLDRWHGCPVIGLKEERELAEVRVEEAREIDPFTGWLTLPQQMVRGDSQVP